MLSLRLVMYLAAALAVTQIAVAQAVEIPAKYRGVYATHDTCELRKEEEIGEFPYLAVTANSVHSHESFCKVIAVRRNVKRNVDHLTFRCSNEGIKSIEKEAWSLEVKAEDVHCCKISQPYLLQRPIGPGAVSSGRERLKKCGLYAAPRTP